MNRVIRTLIVDDSAFARKVVREMLSRSPYIEVVGAARDGLEALELVEELKPDVITCDLVMPEMDGVGFVREQMSRRPIPILILTSSPQDGASALDASRLHVEVAGREGSGSQVHVRVVYRAATDVPIVGALVGDVTVEAYATMRVE